MEAYVIKWATRYLDKDGNYVGLQRAKCYTSLNAAWRDMRPGETVHKVKVTQVTKVELIKEPVE